MSENFPVWLEEPLVRAFNCGGREFSFLIFGERQEGELVVTDLMLDSIAPSCYDPAHDNQKLFEREMRVSNSSAI